MCPHLNTPFLMRFLQNIQYFTKSVHTILSREPYWPLVVFLLLMYYRILIIFRNHTTILIVRTCQLDIPKNQNI